MNNGDNVKLSQSQKNEVLAICLAHNICVMINEIHELGIDPEIKQEWLDILHKKESFCTKKQSV